jgi:hypothetical protein
VVSFTPEPLFPREQRPDWELNRRLGDREPVWTLWRRQKQKILTRVWNRTVQSVIPWLLTMTGMRVICAPRQLQRTYITTSVYFLSLWIMPTFVHLGYHLLRSDAVGKWEIFRRFSWDTNCLTYRKTSSTCTRCWNTEENCITTAVKSELLQKLQYSKFQTLRLNGKGKASSPCAS